MKVPAFLLLIVATSGALPVEVPANIVREGESSNQLPLSRVRRTPQGTWGVDVNNQKGVGTVVSADAGGRVWKNDQGSSLDAQGRWSKVVSGPQRGSPNYGGTLTYTDPKGSVSGSVDRQRNFGTSLGVQADRNLWRSQNGMSSLDAQGSWSKVVSGPARGKPNYGAFVNFSHRF